MHIDAYSFGEITIDGTPYTDDVVIASTGVHPDWWRKAGHAVSLFDLATFLDPQPARLVLGTGADGMCTVLPEVASYCRRMGIELIVATTPEAVAEYNTLSEEEQASTVCALHLTC